MVKLCRETSFYRPYTVEVSGKKYTVSAFLFYDENGIVTTVSQGWLEDSCGRDLKEVLLDTDVIKRKNSLKFDGTVFGHNVTVNYGNEKKINLYIPAKMLNIKFMGNVKRFGDTVYGVYTGDQDIKFYTYVKSLADNLNAISKEYDETIKGMGSYELRYKLDSVKELYKKLGTLIDAYEEEKAMVDSIEVK